MWWVLTSSARDCPPTRCGSNCGPTATRSASGPRTRNSATTSPDTSAPLELPQSPEGPSSREGRVPGPGCPFERSRRGVTAERNETDGCNENLNHTTRSAAGSVYPGLRRDGRQIAYRSAPRPPMPPTARGSGPAKLTERPGSQLQTIRPTPDTGHNIWDAALSVIADSVATSFGCPTSKIAVLWLVPTTTGLAPWA